MAQHRWAEEICHAATHGLEFIEMATSLGDDDDWMPVNKDASFDLFERPGYKFRIADPFEKFKEARKAGKIIQCLSAGDFGEQYWVDEHADQPWAFNCPAEYYRIKE